MRIKRLFLIWKNLAGHSCQFKIRLLAAVLLPLFAVAGCEQSFRPAQPLVPVTIGMAESIFSLPVAMALEQEFFAKEGLQADVKIYSSGKLALLAVLDGEVEFGTSADAPITQNAINDKQFTVLATFNRSFTHGKLVARRDRGIQQTADLHGQRIGLAVGTTAEYYLHRLLAENSIPLDQVEVVNTPTAKLKEAVLSDQVDAIVSWEPMISRASKAMGENAKVFANRHIMRHTFNLVSQPIADDEGKLDKASRVLRGIERGVRFVQDDPAQAKQIMAQRLGMSKIDLEQIWADYMPGLLLDQTFLLTLEGQARWQLDISNSPEPVPDFLQHIDARALRSINPQVVELSF
jgi:NitT/TauT family transport system substrate-binding protein